ncbi:MAG TPA: type II secretion system protein [Chitinivibrionales bacterium]|nr:type II secretion system protein [Chitinivibrionales bacterium]
MKNLGTIVKNAKGFTLMEVIMTMVIIGVTAVVILTWQKTSWTQTKSTNRLMVAGQVIEKQIEKIRMTIAQNPATNYPSFRTSFASKDSVMADTTVTPRMWVRWSTWDTLHDPKGHAITDICQVKLVAWWTGAGVNDSLKVETRIAKNF